GPGRHPEPGKAVLSAMTAARSWTWHIDDEPGFRRPVDKTIVFDGDRLFYRAWVDDVGWGGDYTIGWQTVAEFLAAGPLDDQIPPALLEEVRAAVSGGVDRG